MKKSKYVGLLLAVAMGLSLTGCGKKNGEFKSSADMINKYCSYAELGDYTGLEYTAVNATVSDADVDAQVEQYLSSYTTTEYVTEGTAKMGDTVNISYVGSIDGVEFSGGSTGDEGTTLELGSGTYIDNFEEQVAGHKVGESFDVIVTFPENYGVDDLNGKEAVFATTLNSIAKITKPDYTDEFISSNTNYSTYAEYRENVKTELEKSTATTADNTNKSSIFTIVVDNAVINEYPKQEVEKMLEQTISSVEDIAKGYGYDLATYVTAVYGMSSEESFKEYVSAQIQDIMKEKIVICAIAKAENIEVSKDEIQEYKQELIAKYGYSSTSEFEEDYTYSSDDYMYGALSEKVINFLLENNTPVYDTAE